jgi:Tubulin-tyrosine ligase family
MKLLLTVLHCVMAHNARLLLTPRTQAGMASIARKGRMAQALDRMRRQFPADYNFYPRTWVLPAELTAFRSEFDAQGKSSRTYIIKPDAGCQGKGIYLTQELDERIAGMEPQVRT